MKSFDEIIKEAEEKAKRLAAVMQEVKPENPSQLDSEAIASIKEKLGDSELDTVLKKTLENFLADTKKEKKPKPKPKEVKETKVVRQHPRLSLDSIMEAYSATGLKPCKEIYWFYEDRKRNPLIQVSRLSDDRIEATAFGAYVLMCQAKLEKEESPPHFLSYRDLDRPSNEWSAGRLSQISGLDISYVLGFESGNHGNAPGHPNCSKLYHLGYEDGLSIRKQMIEKGLLKADTDEDIYADETDEDVLFELYRVRGYVKNGSN